MTEARKQGRKQKGEGGKLSAFHEVKKVCGCLRESAANKEEAEVRGRKTEDEHRGWSVGSKQCRGRPCVCPVEPQNLRITEDGGQRTNTETGQ